MSVDTFLQQRGLLAVKDVARIVARDVRGRAGYAYPVLNIRGDAYPELRWKAADGETPKYLWLWNKPERAKYYFLPEFLSSIAANHNTAFLAGGEPDVWAYNAAGITNAFCWLNGEGAPPDTLANDLAHMGVCLLYYVPDRDHAGMVAAHKVARLLEGSGIELVLYRLPGDVGSKYDINEFWLDSGQSADAFKREIHLLPALDVVDAYLYSQQTGPKKQQAQQHVDATIEDWRNEWQRAAMDAMGVPAISDGGRARWHCPLPHHEDRNPSFRFSDDQKPGHLWPMCSCGIQDNKNAWDMVAEALNLESWAAFKMAKAAQLGYLPKTPAATAKTLAPVNSPQIPDEQAPLWVDSHDVFMLLRRELTGDYVPNIQPVVNPLSVLHQFGGFARFMRRGKLTAVTGVSGGGKTLLLMTMMIKLMQHGYDVIWWGPEWDPYEYAEQDLQRLDGLSMDTLDEWRLWQYYERMGMDVVKKMSGQYGLSKPGDAALARSVSKVDEMLAWPGRMYFLPSMEMPLGDVCELAKQITAIKRKEGRDVAAFAFDYVQLARLGGSRDWSWAERVVSEVKAMCSPGAANLCGFVSSQARKKDSEAARDGETLTHGSAQGLSDAQFNLYLAVTPEFTADGSNGDTATLSLVKNSRGRRGKVRVYVDYQHLAVIDKAVTTRALNTAHLSADNDAGGAS